MHRGFTAVLVVLTFPLAGFGQTLTGTVVDPHRRILVGAKVALICGGHTETIYTDSQGRFRFDRRPGLENCILYITHPGFEPFEQVVGRAPEPGLVQLRLGGVKQVVNVSAEDKKGIATDLTTLTSASISDVELKAISNNTWDLIRYAKALAGTTLRQDSLYVDGLPSTVEPPAETIARITVNADPLSAEYAESDQNRIEITTKGGDRRPRFNFGGASLGAGGKSVLASGLHSASRSTTLGLTGPIPGLPLTFSSHASLGYDRQDQAIRAIIPQTQNGTLLQAFSTAPTTNGTGSFFFSSYYPKSHTFRANFSLYQARAWSLNANVGGLTLAEAGINSGLTAHEARATFEKDGARYIYRGGIVVNNNDSHIWANNRSLGITVLDTFVAGGAPIASSRSRHTSWTLKNVVQSNAGRRSWSAGVSVSRSEDSISELPNPAGLIQFETLQAYLDALAGSRTGTWFVKRGNGHVRHANTTSAAFLQGDLLRSRNGIVRGGLRADYQIGAGALLSPRLFAAVQLRGFTLRGGGGVFVRNWQNDIFLESIRGDGRHLRQFILKDVSLADVGSRLESDKDMVISRISPDLVRPRDFMFKGSIERRLGNFIPGLEYTWTSGQHLLGSRRLATETGWMDLLESGRLSRKHQLHARLHYEWKGQSIVAHYEYIRSHDNTDGPFSFPERQDDLRAEWARTGGVPPHNFDLVGSFKLPAAVSLSLVATSRSSAPSNITASTDTPRNGLYNDRAGRARNSGIGPGYNSLALFGYRRIPLPHFLVRSGEKVHIDVGFQVENLLGNKNHLGFGSVMGSPLFGKPLGALPGRSFRLWFNFGQ
ncbi:MAG: carboxypeptidase regulatory-like domain-containing protein [Acidobacteria bacterium]|nr:carboxypeptidase regulatory-like domain-containing protein [Acidobacteriota bacterium]MBI3657716.1 carboxypeptidase regulatory-like domain-containing protein [Acidobacteriota bacterium]